LIFGFGLEQKLNSRCHFMCVMSCENCTAKSLHIPYTALMIRVFGWMRAMIAAGLVMVLSAPEAANDTLETGLAGFWRFQHCSTYDSSQSARSGRFANGVVCEKGRIGDAMRLRGTKFNDYFEAENLPAITLTKTFAINVWFRIESHTSLDPNHNETEYGTQVLLAKSDDRTGLSIRLERSFEDGHWYPYLSNGHCCEQPPEVISRVSKGAGIRLHEWHMITVVYQPGLDTLELYLDGTKKSVVSAKKFNLNPKTDSEALIIGADRRGIWYPFDGLIDEVRVYTRALNKVEIMRLLFERDVN
jgi:Concanavalin A-like lectin/glucanases superfamily